MTLQQAIDTALKEEADLLNETFVVRRPPSASSTGPQPPPCEEEQPPDPPPPPPFPPANAGDDHEVHGGCAGAGPDRHGRPPRARLRVNHQVRHRQDAAGDAPPLQPPRGEQRRQAGPDATHCGPGHAARGRVSPTPFSSLPYPILPCLALARVQPRRAPYPTLTLSCPTQPCVQLRPYPTLTLLCT